MKELQPMRKWQELRMRVRGRATTTAGCRERQRVAVSFTESSGVGQPAARLMRSRGEVNGTANITHVGSSIRRTTQLVGCRRGKRCYHAVEWSSLHIISVAWHGAELPPAMAV